MNQEGKIFNTGGSGGINCQTEDAEAGAEVTSIFEEGRLYYIKKYISINQSIHSCHCVAKSKIK